MLELFIQGTLGSYSYTAAQYFAGQIGGVSRIVPCASFSEAVENSVHARNGMAVLPVENSTVGPINANYDLIRTRQLSIKAEFYMPIRHCLLGIKGTRLEEIKEVYSHPVALQQCQRFFQQNPAIAPVEFTDTAAASALVRDRNEPSLASISQAHAAQIYGLDTLVENVQDYPNNQTRFALLRPKGTLDQDASGRCQVQPGITHKTTVLIENVGETVLPQVPSTTGVLITSVVVRPMAEYGWRYAVFVDLCWQLPEQIQAIATILEGSAKEIGTYPKWEPGLPTNS